MAIVRKEIIQMRESVAKVVSLLSRTSVKVSMSGTRAYVENDMEGKPVRVNIPALPDDASDLAIMAVRGFVDHEVAHILFTDFKTRCSIPTALEPMWNSVEDIFIERKMSQVFTGSRSNLSKVRHHLLETVFDNAYKKAVDSGMKGVELFNRILAVPALRAMAGQTEFADWMGDKWDRIDILKTRIEDARIPKKLTLTESTSDCIEVARVLLSLIIDETQKEQEREEEDKPEESEGKVKSPDLPKTESKDEGEDESGDDQPSEAKDDEKPEESIEIEVDAGSADEEGEDDGGKDEENDEIEVSGSSDGKSEESDEEDQGRSKPDSTATDTDTDMGFDFDLKDLDELEGIDDKVEPLSIEDALEEALSDAIDDSMSSYRPLTDQFDIYDVVENIGKQAAQVQTHEYFGENKEGAERYRKYFDDLFVNGERAFNRRIEAHLGDTSKNMAKQLERVVRSQNKSQWLGGQKKGRIHGASLFKLKTGDVRVFRTKEEHRSREAAVQIVVDFSGSMHSGDRIGTSLRSAYVMAEALDRCGIACRVVGFTSLFDLDVHGFERYLMSKKIKPGTLSFSRLEPLLLPILKDWDDKANTKLVKKRFGALAGNFPLANNADGECILRFIPSLMSRPESLKMMVVLSDGEPCARGRGMAEHLRAVTRFIEQKTDIKLLGIGIQTDSVKRFYSKHAVVNDLSELPAVVCGKIRELVA